MKLLWFSIKMVRKRKLLWSSYLLMLLVVNGFYCNCLNWLGVSGYSEFLPDSQQIGILGFLYFAFFAYEYFGNERHVSLSELMDVYPLGRVRMYMCQFAVVMLLILVVTCVAVVYQTAAYNISQIGYRAVLMHAVANVVLNFTLVMIIGALLGILLSHSEKRTTAYAGLLVSAFVISPLMNTIASMLSYAFDSYGVLDFISILAPNLNWRPDDLYGLSIEAARWNVSFFWILFFLAIITYLLYGKRSKKAGIVCVLLAMLSAAQFCMAAQMENDSIIRKDDRKNGALSGDHYYWKVHESRLEAAAFEVLAYEMVFDIGRNLSAEVVVKVTPTQDGGRYRFTLYHGFEIQSITDESDSPLEYSREGDYLEVSFDCTEAVGEIWFSYQGNGNKYYSNGQGIALPGYFPFYPMEGYVDTWAEEGNDIIPNTDFSGKQFTVTVNTDLPLLSNLETVGEHTYAGIRSTVSLYGGLMESREADGVTYMWMPITPSVPDIAAIETATGFDLSGMTLILQPATLVSGSGSDQENFVVFDDHIITSSYHTQAFIDQLLQYCEGIGLPRE